MVLLLACKECSRMDMRGDTDAVVVSLLLTLSHFMEKSITMEKVLQLGLVAGGGIGTKEWEELARETLEKEGTR